MTILPNGENLFRGVEDVAIKNARGFPLLPLPSFAPLLAIPTAAAAGRLTPSLIGPPLIGVPL